MLLVDTSAWVLMHVEPEALVAQAQDHQIATCPPIAQELLQGSHDMESFEDLRETLSRYPMLDATIPLERYEEAARLYIRCRAAGVTPRKSMDCLIAAIAIAHDVPVLHVDRDFELIARVVPLREVRLV